MRGQRHVRLTVIAWLATLPLGLYAADGHTLRYRFQAGQFAHYEVKNSMAITTRSGDFNQTDRTESHAWKQFRVVSVDAQGGATLEPLVERVRMSAQTGGNPETSFDTADAVEPPVQFRNVKQNIGKPTVRLQVTALGQLLKITPLTGDFPSLTEAAARNDSLLNFLIVFPEQPVKVGDVWKDAFSVPVTVGKGLSQELKIQRRYQLVSVDGDIATIQLKAAPLAPVTDPQIEMQLMTRMPESTIRFDLAKGIIVSQESVINREVVGAFGAKTQVKCVSTNSEQLVAPGAARAVQQTGGVVR